MSPEKQAALPKIKELHLAFKDREYFIENLALLLKAAVPVSQALASLQETAKTKAMRQTLSAMQADIESGTSLAGSLEKSGTVSGQTLALVRLGEQSGHLVENMQLAAQQEEKRHTFRSKVRSALIYPRFVLSLTVIVGLGVAWFLLPRLAGTFSQLNVALPLPSKIMIGLGIFLREHGLVAVPSAFAVFGIVGYIMFGAPKTKVIGQRFLLALPGVGKLMREVEVAQFGYLLGTMLDAGLAITKAIDLLAESSTLQQYQQFYRELSRSLEDGHTFQETLKGYKKISTLFPPSVQQMVIAGERSGSLSDVLKTVGRTFEQKADITTQNLEATIEPVLLVIVWVGVMGVAVAVIVTIYSLVGGLGG